MMAAFNDGARQFAPTIRLARVLVFRFLCPAGDAPIGKRKTNTRALASAQLLPILAARPLPQLVGRGIVE